MSDSTPNPTNSVKGSPAWQEEQRKQKQEQFRQLSERLFNHLDQLGVAKVSVGFDGFGDDGQIEYMKAKMRAEDHGLMLNVASFEGRSVYAAIEELIYGQLDTGHAGWQNEGGSFGVYTLDVARRQIREKFVAREEDDGGDGVGDNQAD